MPDKKKLLIDTDAGVDDAQAILLALTNPDVEVIGITCVDGNTNTHQVGMNVLRILQVVNRLDILVYIGCTHPLLGEKKPCYDYHGVDGFGDVPDINAPDSSHLQTEHGVNALVRVSKAHEGEITLVCLGPLTNIAMAVRMDSMFGTRLKHCFIMGGNHEGKGNMTAAAEFNFYSDPEAAFVVLNQLKTPITMVTWETCENHPLSWEFYRRARAPDTAINNFLRKIEKHSAQFAEDHEWGSFATADELLMSCCLSSDVIKKSCDVYATVDTKGQYTWGQMVVDWKSFMKQAKNVTIITDINQNKYEELLLRLNGI